uniref:SCP domain-containing protein n=1 Tax=Heterorhabditis bacteriophora TaxID=37862 RepID=A0A1I7WWI0_HETBA
MNGVASKMGSMGAINHKLNLCKNRVKGTWCGMMSLMVRKWKYEKTWEVALSAVREWGGKRHLESDVFYEEKGKEYYGKL